MNASTIKEFLVSLGWKIDQAGMRSFATSVATQTVALQELARATEAVADKLLHFFEQIADGAEKLYFVSLRTKASAANIQALGFAADQMGSSAEAATASLESMARMMRTNPGGENLIASLGVQTREANGDLRDTSDILQDVGKQLAQMPYYRANAYGQVLGIDEKTLMALREGLGQFGDEYKGILQAVGLDSQTAAKSSHAFMNQLRGVRATFEAVTMAAAAKALPALTKYSVALREKLVQNLPWITDILTRVLKGIAFITGSVGQLAGRAFEAVRQIIDWWNRLDQSSKTVIETIGGLIVAWRLLNSAFLMSPIGILTALGAAILLLYDDYKTWKEGGKSLIDWAQWEPAITQAKEAIKDLIGLLKELKQWTELNLSIGVLDPKNAKNLINSTAGTYRALKNKDWKTAADAFRGLGPAAHPEARDTPENTAKLFGGLEAKYNLPAGLLDAVYSQESGRGRRLDNKDSGAQGPFQFMPPTAKEYGLSNPYDLKQSAEAAARKYQHLLGYYKGDLSKALAAYNWGEGRLDSRGVAAEPKETKNYVAQIHNMMANSAAVSSPATNPYAAEGKQLTSATNDNSKTGPTIHQTTNVTVNGAADPHKTAKAVGDATNSANQQLIRNTVALAY